MSGAGALGGLSGHPGPNEVKRKPSPLWLGDEMLETVGMIWGVSREWLEKDSEETKRSGKLEQVSRVLEDGKRDR